MRTKVIAIAATLCLALGVPCIAAARGQGRIRHRQRNQVRRIRGGVKDRSLTPREARRLGREQVRIERHRRRAASDGRITPRERWRLEREQDRASRDIFRQRHDRQGRFGPHKNWRTWDPGVNRRQRNQKYRVAHGIKNGSLTRDEVRAIAEQERRIAKLERGLKSDGVLTIKERKQLHQMLNETSRLIYDEKHDDENRPRPNPVIIEKIESGEITGAEAKELCEQMKRIRELKRILGGTTNLTPEQRARLEAEFDALAANLHE